jgi:hypothetical protein
MRKKGKTLSVVLFIPPYRDEEEISVGVFSSRKAALALIRKEILTESSEPMKAKLYGPAEISAEIERGLRSANIHDFLGALDLYNEYLRPGWWGVMYDETQLNLGRSTLNLE